jgi:enoyl-CoA hydratase/carnithine racemase
LSRACVIDWFPEKDMSDTVIQQLGDGVLELTLNRPARKNAFNREQWLALADALNDARDNPAVACVLITGAGGNFSSGVDLADFGAGDPDEEQPFYRTQRAVFDFDKPLLAAAQGVAIGGGATLLLHCDVIYVAPSLRLRFPFVNLGLVPEFGSSYTLAAMIGTRRAAELMYTARWLTAQQALDYGIATAVIDDADLVSHARATAQEIAQWPVRSLQETKRCLKAAHTQALRVAGDIEQAGMMKLAGSPENIEAVTAFIEKRAPNFAQFRR